ncbi:sigma-70 region 4 domain-containing protein, partial [bacterium]|nr:sigma-70 region 4 domain-containing protein [bacterium]
MQYDLFTGKQFKVVWLRVVCQLSYKEIAKKMHTTPGAIRQ